MMNTAICSALLGASMFCLAHPVAALQEDPRGQLLVDVDWLEARIDDPGVVVLHVGRNYDDGHIPGSAPLDLGAITYSSGEVGSPDHVMLDLPPDLATAREAFEIAGVSDGSTVVVAFEGRGMANATRVLWTLEVLGLGAAGRLLDGGLGAWTEAGNALSTEAGSPARGRIEATPRLDRRVGKDFVRAEGASPGITLVDARRVPHFRGEEEETEGRAGHIPGAGSVFFGDLFTEDARLKPADELRSLLEQAGLSDGDQVVAYCHIGLWGSGVVFAARTLGLDAVLYDGSMREWAWDRSLPLERSPGGR
jgi:thiosulfate/3-mercaptopyruvate sulfurtransferase